MTKLYLCPECKKPLRVANHGPWTEVWCGWGPCTSERCNEGAGGVTVDEAFAKLEDRWENAKEDLEGKL